MRLTKDVRRLDLMFKNEDSELFLKRREEAENYRERFKSSIRLRSYLETYIKKRVDITTSMDSDTLNRILNAAHGGSKKALDARNQIEEKRKREEEDGEKISVRLILSFILFYNLFILKANYCYYYN
jgi:hypothetical protein